ncbi:hypothetical protein [Kordia jejudonensis]|uniref:hypothetical protein n=1 Tax=Kordia jejudonensis TaxID=1348245 RepID=UPI000629B3BF|nr:hypothetical protein [Kordia jejudonensis]
MKKALLCIIALVILSCSSDDEPIRTESAINFTLNGINYFVTEFTETLETTDENWRRIEASFDDNTKTLVFYVLEEETNQIGEFFLIEDDVYYSSDVNFGNRETSITTHTDSKMEGTFRVTIENTRNQPIYTFTNGVINIEY